MTDDALFELVLYLVACARLSLDEPPIYGSFRLVDAASRLIDAAGVADALLRESRDAIEREKLRMIDDRPGYTDWLDTLLVQLTAEARLRNLGKDAGEPLR